MKKVFVRTQNVKNFISLMNSIQNKPEGVPRMALVYGEPGLGKSRTALWLASQQNAILIRCANLMTPKWFLEELASELDEIPKFLTADLFRQCVESLNEKPRMIIVDEVDYLLRESKTIETLRDLHDKADIPIIMVGMNLAQRKISRYKHIQDRITEVIKFNVFMLSDVQEIVQQLSEIEFSKEAVALMHTNANRFRQIVKFITKSEILAKTNNLKLIDENILMELIKNEQKHDFNLSKGA